MENEENLDLRIEEDIVKVSHEINDEPIGQKDYKFGRRVIRIPVTRKVLNEHVIHVYLPEILQAHMLNVSDYFHLKGLYTGRDSHIWRKERAYDTLGAYGNNFVEEGHAFRIVESKKAILYGNDSSYSFVEDAECNDELKYLNKYMTNQKKASKNTESAEDVYIAGSGYTMVVPRSSNGLNLDKEAPFTIYNLDYPNTFVVYSSTYTKEKLFGGIITTIDSTDKNDIQREITIYSDDWIYVYAIGSASGGSLMNPTFIGKYENPIGKVNIVERKANKTRISPIERVETILDAINNISSMSLDNIGDYVDSILAVYNQEVTRDALQDVKDNKALQLITVDPQRPADAKYLTNALNLADVQVKYESLVTLAYTIAGVPLATTKSTSGGDTGEARELGGGWTNAVQIANQEAKMLIEAEKEILDLCLTICKMTEGCPVDTILESDIKVSLNITNSENLLVKMQSLKYAYDMHMPLEPALAIVNVTNNTHEIAHAWEERDEELLEKETEAKRSKTYERFDNSKDVLSPVSAD